MRKVINIDKEKRRILVLCDDLEKYGRDVTVKNLCEWCPMLKHPERQNGYDLDCKSRKKILEERGADIIRDKTYGRIVA